MNTRILGEDSTVSEPEVRCLGGWQARKGWVFLLFPAGISLTSLSTPSVSTRRTRFRAGQGRAGRGRARQGRAGKEPSLL